MTVLMLIVYLLMYLMTIMMFMTGLTMVLTLIMASRSPSCPGPAWRLHHPPSTLSDFYHQVKHTTSNKKTNSFKVTVI